MKSLIVNSENKIGAPSAPALPAGEPPFLNRDLSWLEFNRRVLSLALDDRTPLLERVRFLSIFSANLDEFFQKRVGGLKRQIAAGVVPRRRDDVSPARLLAMVRQTVLPLLAQQARCFEQKIRPALAANGIDLLTWDGLAGVEREAAGRYFKANVYPVLTPLAVDPGHPFPFISNLSTSLGTGNCHPQTAQLYTDLGLLSCDAELTAELVERFNYLTGRSLRAEYSRLLVAPINMKERFLALIAREAGHAAAGRPSGIVAKMNSLEDRDIVLALYEAGRAGVPVDLIVRGFCCLRPGAPGLSENVRVVPVLGRFLEHSRIFHFRNGAADPLDGDWYLGSADWMERNLQARVEAVTPVRDRALRERCRQILDVMLADRRQAWDMRLDGSYVRRRPGPEDTGPAALGTHQALMDLARERGRPGAATAEAGAAPARTGEAP